MASLRAATLVLLAGVASVAAQEMSDCYSAGSIAGAVLGTLVVTLALVALGYALYRIYWRNRRGKHLVLVTDPERADLGDQYAFDNPCFRDGTPIGKVGYEKEPVKSENKNRWSAWSPLGALVNNRNEKRRALDDSFTGEPQVNVVSLRSHDFTGLGFSVCGNMRDGIFVKDVLHRGPASESGRITTGDRIDSIRISFRHMVFEDALTILSYASPYEVQLEVENPSPSSRPSTLLRTKRESIEPADRICHPFYRSQSIADLAQIGTASLKRVQDIGGLKSPRGAKGEAWDETRAGDYPTLKLSPLPTKETVNLEKTSSSPKHSSTALVKPERMKKPPSKSDVPSATNEGNLPKDVKPDAIGKHQKFGVRVLPDPKTLMGHLKNTSQEVKQSSDGTKKAVNTKVFQNVTLSENKNVKNANVIGTEHRENEQNSKVEQINVVPVPIKMENAFLAQPGRSVDVVDTGRTHGRAVAKSLVYDERGIDVGPVEEEEENRRKSASYEPRRRDEELVKPNTEGGGAVDGHSNVKLLLTKGLQNLKEKLHHHDRKKNSVTPEPQPDVEVNPNPSPTKKKPAKVEKVRKMLTPDNGVTSEKTEVKMRQRVPITNVPSKEDNKENEQTKELKPEGDMNQDEGQFPTDMPEEVRRAAAAAQSNRKSCSNIAQDVNIVTLVQGNSAVDDEVQSPPEQLVAPESSRSTSPPVAAPVKQRVHHQESWSEDSSGDDLGTGTLGSNDSDSIDRAPKRSNKRKAPLPPPEDIEETTVTEGGRLPPNSDINVLQGDHHRRVPTDNEMDTKQKDAKPVIVNNEIQIMGVHNDPDSYSKFTDMARQQNNPPPQNEVTNIMVESNSETNLKSVNSSRNNVENITVDVSPTSFKKVKNGNSESDSDTERQDTSSFQTSNKKGGTTIELNSSHITIHHSPSADTVTLELEADSTRKAASLGDLSRLDTDQPMSVLERAVSLDLADSGTPHSCKKRKAPLPPPGEDFPNTVQDGDDETLYRKEPRLDNALDTFQRRRLKKSSDWGTMEDAVQQSSPPNSRKTSESVSDIFVTLTGSNPAQVVDFILCDKTRGSTERASTPEETSTSSVVGSDTVKVTSIPQIVGQTLESIGKAHSLLNTKDERDDRLNVQLSNNHTTKNRDDTEMDTEIVHNTGDSHGKQKTILRITPEPINNFDSVSSSRVTFTPTSSTSGPSSLSTEDVTRSLTPDRESEIAGSRLLPLIQGVYRNDTNYMAEDPDTSIDSTPNASQLIEHHTIFSSTPLPNREVHKRYVETIQSPQVTSSDGVRNIQVVGSSTNEGSAVPSDFANISQINDSISSMTSEFESSSLNKTGKSFEDTDRSISVTSATEPYVTAASIVDSTTTYVGNSDDEDSTLGHDFPPELPTSPVPVLAATYTPSSSMTYITEIQVPTVTPNKGIASHTVAHNGVADIETSSGLKTSRKRDSSISSDSIGSGGEDKDLESNVIGGTKSQENNAVQHHNNITVTAIRNAAGGNSEKSKIPTRTVADNILTSFQSTPVTEVFDRSLIPTRTSTEGVLTSFQSSSTHVKNLEPSQIPVRVNSEGLTTFKSNVSVGSGERSQIPTRVTSNVHEGLPSPNNGVSLGEKKHKAVRPPVPPRKSDTTVTSVVTVEIPSSNRPPESVHNKFVATTSPYGIYESNPNAENSSESKKFISFSSLTPRTVSGDGSVRNSSFEQWVFLEGDNSHTSNGNPQNGQDISGEDNSHSTVVTLPGTAGSRLPSVTHILLDSKQSSGSRNSQ